MRIIGGRWRSRRIDWPARTGTRPITDRAKESVFDTLGSRYGTPGALPGLFVADVFAGGGSLGLEALSRGAAQVCFVERDPRAVEVLKRNLDRLGTGPEAIIVTADVWRTALCPPPSHFPVELLFLDPPFGDANHVSNGSKVGTLLRRLGTADVVADSALIVFRHERHVRLPGIIANHWTVCHRREYGRSAVSLLVRRPVETSADVADEAATLEEDHGGLV